MLDIMAMHAWVPKLACLAITPSVSMLLYRYIESQLVREGMEVPVGDKATPAPQPRCCC